MASKEEDIKAIENDVLIIHGRDDKVIPFENSIRLHQLIKKNHNFIVLDNVVTGVKLNMEIGLISF